MAPAQTTDNGTQADASTTQTEGTATEGAADAEASALPEMTTDEITLTYMHFDNEQLVNAVADAFMAKYPNIKVETQAFSTDGYNDTLLNLVQSGQTPDCFMILGNCDFALSNALLGDMTPPVQQSCHILSAFPLPEKLPSSYLLLSSSFLFLLKFIDILTAQIMLKNACVFPV